MTVRKVADGRVVTRRVGRVGHLILNRPETINALTGGMVHALAEALGEWALDPRVETVVLTGAGTRGLCAGGDIVAMSSGEHSPRASTALFIGPEYRLNAAIATFPKPFVAIMDGIVLGGGVGLSAHGSHRVVTERSRIGMPETAIGLIPDVGSTWLLTRPGGHLGTHLALTGSIVDAADAIEAGLADVMIDSASIPLLLTALETSDVDAALAQFTREPPASALAGRRDWIDELYAAPSVAVVLDRLRQSGVAEARSAAELIESRSPSAVMAAFEAITRARLMTRLTDVLNQEHRVMLHLAAAPDFFEGVRAQVVDKDRKPHWNPRSIGQVHPDTVLANFDPLEGYPDLFSGEEPTCR